MQCVKCVLAPIHVLSVCFNKYTSKAQLSTLNTQYWTHYQWGADHSYIITHYFVLEKSYTLICILWHWNRVTHFKISCKWNQEYTKYCRVHNKPASCATSTGCKVMTGTGRVLDGLPQSRVLPVFCSASHWTAIQSRQPTALYTITSTSYTQLHTYQKPEQWITANNWGICLLN